MIDATFTPSMCSTLQSLTGQRLISLECEPLEETQETYGNLLITTESQRIELINEEEPTPYSDGSEDISRFTCHRLTPQETFRQFVMGDHPVTYPLSGTVTQVRVVNDRITLPHENYTIQLSMALILDTNEGQIAFLRGWHFDEMITVIRDGDYRQSLRPVEHIRSDWGDDADAINVTRTIITL